MNRLLKSLVRLGFDLLDQPERTASRMRDRIQDRAERLASRATLCRQNHALLSAVNLAAGVGVGIGLGMLLAPASGKQTRRYITQKTEDLGDAVREYFESEMKPVAGA